MVDAGWDNWVTTITAINAMKRPDIADVFNVLLSRRRNTLSTSGWSHNHIVGASYISSAAFVDAVAAVRSVTTTTANYYYCSPAALSSPGPSGTSPLNRPPSSMINHSVWWAWLRVTWRANRGRIEQRCASPPASRAILWAIGAVAAAARLT